MEINGTFQYNQTNDLPRLGWVEQVNRHIASASVVLRAGLSWIFNLGLQPDMPFYLKGNLAMVNRVAFVSLLLALPGSFVLLLVGIDHPFSLMVSGVLTLWLIRALDAARRVQ